MTRGDLQLIAVAGGGLDLSAKHFSRGDLQLIAGSGKGSGAKLILRDCGHLSRGDMQLIAGSSPGNVTFVL